MFYSTMDLTTSTPPPTNSTVKTPEPQTETPTRNGVLKRHAPLHHHHHAIVVTYKECLKNHAASLGTHALDGCGEFMPSPTSNPTDPTSLKCAACGCHRNFHRRDPDETPPLLLPPPPALDYQPHHRHHPPPPDSPVNSPSPPPISSAYAPHMLLALSHSGAPPPPDIPTPTPQVYAHTGPQILSSGSSRKRFRTKFTQEQKEKMLDLAEKVGWKMQKKDEDTINESCTKIGVDKSVFKVWMHNNKNTTGRKDQTTSNPITSTTTTTPSGSISYSIGYLQEGNKDNFHHQELNNGSSHSNNNNNRAPPHLHLNHHQNQVNFGATNGSSTSS